MGVIYHETAEDAASPWQGNGSLAQWISAWQSCPSLLALRRVSKAPLSHEPVIGGFCDVFAVDYTATGILLAID